MNTKLSVNSNDHPYTLLEQPTLVEIDYPISNISGLTRNMKGLAVAMKVSYREPWYLVLINEKLLWFRYVDLKELK